jgi:hypothetical protein
LVRIPFHNTTHGSKHRSHPAGGVRQILEIFMFYAAVNSRATDTSIGFCNTWGVIGFATRAMRDAYVKRADDFATRAIASKEVGKYDSKIGEVDYYDAAGDLMVHTQRGEFMRGGKSIDPVTAQQAMSYEDLAVEAYWSGF